MSPDMINGAFEALAGLMIMNHCRDLYRDKQVKGVSVLSTVFFFCWGAWNLFYYPSLNQPFSFYGGLVVVSANACWVSLMVYYTRQTNSGTLL